MANFFDTHLHGCTPDNRCKKCQLADTLEKRFGQHGVGEIGRLIGECVAEKAKARKKR